MKNLRLCAVAVVLTLVPAAGYSQALLGLVEGTVKDEQGGALAGANLTLTGKTGAKTSTSDAAGHYRFPAVDPGTYSLQADISGFQGKRLEGVVVTVGRTASLDFTLKVATLAETIEVSAEAPVVDTTSSATSNQLSQDLLFNLPIRPGNAAVDLLNFTPGINFGSAFGNDSDTANALLLDGVDTRDPEGGSAWTFFNYNIVEELQVQGLGAQAEYGAFTGAVVNTITRSGGNRFAGLFDVIYSKASFFSDNISPDVIRQNAALASPNVTKKLLDFTTQLSGPIIKDKLFFFVSAERFKFEQDPSGPRTIRDEVSPRFNVKLTYQPSANDHFTATFQADDYNVIGRPGVSALLATDDLTNREDAPELVWLGQWRHVFGPNTFTEVKYTGWSGYFDLNPEVELPGHFDTGNGLYSVSQGWFYYADRGRHQVNAAVSHYADAFGKHDLKFGVEIERSKVRSRYGYINDIFYYDYAAYYPVGQYTAYDYGYDVEGRNQRESLFAQDSWKVSDRLTLNAGVRLDAVRGKSPKLDSTVYDTKNIAPRLGFAFDVTGDHKTVVKGSYGQYYEGAFFLTFSGAVPGIEDFVLYAFDPSGDKCGPAGNCFTEYDRSPATLYKIDPDIKHPRVDEFTLGFERAVSNDVRLAVTGVWRKDKNLQGSVAPSARWEPIQLQNRLTGEAITAYRWVNRAESETDLLITNPDGFAYLDTNGNVLGRAKAGREYKGLIFVLDKRLSNRWLGRISYVLSKAEGSVDNDGFNSYGTGTDFESASRALVNADGRLTNDIRHELKVMASYTVPKIELGLNAYFRSISGGTYTPFEEFSSRVINFPLRSGRRLRLEPRGSREFERITLLDLRLEKVFKIGERKDRIALYADINNVFNADTVTGVINRYPDQAIGGVDEPVEFGAPASIIAPRRFTLGARWSF